MADVVTPAGRRAPSRLPAAHPVTRAVDGWLAAGHVDPAAPLIVACSGGADSLALAGAVLAVTRGAARTVAAAVIDHGLQEASAQVTADAAETLRAMGFREVITRRVDVDRAGGVEAAARAARYAALAEIAHEAGAPAVLVAHTADDQAETVLLGLARGSGPRSIAGMSPWAPPWGRPLLAVRRTDTEDACRVMGVAPWQDPHNANPAFTRVRLRRQVMPLLGEVLGGGVVPALARTAELMADDLAALDTLAAAALRDARTVRGEVDCRALVAFPSAIRRRALRAWVRERAGVTTLTYGHLVALEEIVIHGHSRQAVRLPGAIDAVRAGALLTIDPPAALPSDDGGAPGREDDPGGVAG